MTRKIKLHWPDSFVFVSVLTLLVIISGLIFTDFSIAELLTFWSRSLWSLNQFSMQMTLILALGTYLAHTSEVSQLINKVISRIDHALTAIIVLNILSLFLCWLNWGLGLILSAVMARFFGKKFRGKSYALFVASAYSGFIVWHGGLSGTIPLKVAGFDEVLQQLSITSIPISKTIFSELNLFIVLLHFLLFPLLTLIMFKFTSKKKNQNDVFDIESDSPKFSFESNMFENLLFKFLSFVIFIVTMTGFISGQSLDINIVNTLLLSLCFLFTRSTRQFSQSGMEAIKIAAPLILQFPLYAALMGLIQGSGLGERLATIFLSVPSGQFAFLTYLSAGLLNLFIPSGGGQWVIQGPVVLKSALELNLPLEKIILSLSWGDAWTNLIQPFWAIPILALANLKIRDIIPYCFGYLVLSGFITLVGISIF